MLRLAYRTFFICYSLVALFVIHQTFFEIFFSFFTGAHLTTLLFKITPTKKQQQQLQQSVQQADWQQEFAKDGINRKKSYPFVCDTINLTNN